MPLPSSQSVAGREPMPTTTRSASNSDAVRQHHLLAPGRAPLTDDDADTSAHVDALGSVQPRHQRADLLAQHRRQRRGLRFDEHDVRRRARAGSRPPRSR